jgi:hypothetical protein
VKKLKSLDDITAVRMYLARINAEPRSLKTAVIKEVAGNYWRDTAIITITREGEVKAPEHLMPTEQEAMRIKDEVAMWEWPQLKKLKHLDNLKGEAGKELKAAKEEDIFEFRDKDGWIVMVQLRKQLKDGEKAYIPFTYWDDNEWRKTEPDGPLPLWGLEALGDHSTVFIHEGAKAARKMRWMVEGKTVQARQALRDHPWGEELSAACHLGWIGGALSPQRTDWTVLKRAGVRRAYIVSDNDPPGVAAVPRISFPLNLPTFHVQFTNEWPASFDLADDFPKAMFKELDGHRRYVGPSFRSCLHPATWMTDLIANPKGKPTPVLREHAKEMWAFVEEADLFVCTQMPEILRDEKILNKMLSPFSHTYENARLIVRAYRGRNTKLCYRPDNKGRIVTDGNTSAINLHTPSLVRAEEGNPKPWLDFVSYMIPDEDERREVLRWAATLIARPDIRMEYGLLLVSEKQGIGKTTFGSSILAPLVGAHNVGWPSESDITNSAFNDWVAHKRLIIVNEIYSGHSWKAYNQLKSLITDTEVQVNQKYQRRYLIQNWAHIFACSNSRRALRMEEDDRRWFYPECTEERWPKEKFVELRKWLSSGGLGIIKTWAQQWTDYVLPGQRAPMTDQKKELIEGSRSEAQVEAAQIAESLKSVSRPAALAMKEVVMAVRAACQGRVFDSDLELRKSMVETGAFAWKKRLKVGGRMQFIVINEAMRKVLADEPEEKHSILVKQHLKKPQELFEQEM